MEAREKGEASKAEHGGLGSWWMYQYLHVGLSHSKKSITNHGDLLT